VPPQDALALCVAAGFVFIYGRIWFRRHREAPLRREIRARDVTFRTVLDRVKVSDSGGRQKWAGVTAPMDLFVRGDAIEVSSTVALVRVVMGLEYYFPAAGTSIELSRSPSLIYRGDWIVLTGRLAGQDIQVAITTMNDHTLLEAWNALVTAGAIPTGLPPQAPG
jgi:hypothetical protein